MKADEFPLTGRKCYDCEKRMRKVPDTHPCYSDYHCFSCHTTFHITHEG